MPRASPLSTMLGFRPRSQDLGFRPKSLDSDPSPKTLDSDPSPKTQDPCYIELSTWIGSIKEENHSSDILVLLIVYLGHGTLLLDQCHKTLDICLV